MISGFSGDGGLASKTQPVVIADLVVGEPRVSVWLQVSRRSTAGGSDSDGGRAGLRQGVVGVSRFDAGGDAGGANERVVVRRLGERLTACSSIRCAR